MRENSKLLWIDLWLILIDVYHFRFPKPQDEAWFLVLGNVEDNQDMLALKRVNTVRGPTTQQLTFWTPERPGRMILTLYIMSDTYLGLDQQYDIHLEVVWRIINPGLCIWIFAPKIRCLSSEIMRLSKKHEYLCQIQQISRKTCKNKFLNFHAK